MSKINVMTHFDSISGKYSKTDKVYTKVRKVDNLTIGVALKHPATNQPPTTGQAAAQAKLTATVAAVATEMADTSKLATYKEAWRKQRKYKTVRGFIFAKLYNQTEEED